MLALRSLLPVVGHSVPVVAVVFGGVLVGLAAGYRAGGWRPLGSPGAAAAFAVSAVWLAAALWMPAVQGVAGVLRTAAGWGWWAVVVYAGVLVAPGMMFAAWAVASLAGRRVARGGGRMFAASTAGNVAGGLATGLVLQDALGVGWTAALAVACVGGGGALACSGGGNWRLWALAAGSAGWITNVAVVDPDVVARTAYADYRFVEVASAGSMCAMGNRQLSSCEDGEGGGLGYLEAAEDVFAEAGIREVLVFGAAARMFGKGRGDRLAPVFVDIDPGVASVAARFARWSGGEPPRGRLVVAEARAYLLGLAPGSVRGMLLDAYADFDAVPPHLATAEFFALARSRVAPDGLVAVNAIHRTRPHAYRAAFDRALASAFGDCRMARRSAEGPWLKRLVVCRRSVVDGERRVLP